ncbi:MAG: helix-turn-helix transcriptional regulator [Rikenellaceae bacterium]
MKKRVDPAKLASLPNVDEMLSAKYGAEGSIDRTDFDAKSRSWYYAEILKDARKSAGITQKELAAKIGKKREYIAMLERGETDMQLSTFILITEALGLRFALTLTALFLLVVQC